MSHTETKKDRRRKGREIRKARREASAASDSIDWRAIGQAFEALAELLIGAFEAMGRAAAAFGPILSAAVERAARMHAMYRAETERAQRDWMLTYRALPSAATKNMTEV